MIGCKPRPTAVLASSDSQTWCILSAAALTENLNLLRGLLPTNGALMAVLKSEAYGHGMGPVADLCWRQGVRSFGVNHLHEAIALRRRLRRASITLIGPFQAEWAATVVEHRVQVQVHDRTGVEALHQAARRQDRTVPLSIKCDTGMSRLGCALSDLPALLAAVRARRTLDLRGLASHFACADHVEDTAVREQFACFQAAIALGRRLGFALPCNHIANSAATLQYAWTRLDQVRCGIALYGLPPAPHLRQQTAGAGLRPVLSGLARLGQIRDLPTGQGVGYGLRWRAARPSRIAIVPLGYADGYRRLAEGERRCMEFDGRLLPVVGQVCMNMTMLDVTDAPSAQPGSIVTWLSNDPASPLSAESLAAAWRTIPYEVVTGLSGLLPRLINDVQAEKV